MKIYSVCDKQFNQFGKVIESPFHHLFEKQSLNIPMPESGLKYMASVSEFETQESMAYYRKAFGEVDIQIGYCWGENKMLNGLEWHNCIEINCALEDMILMLADLRDMVSAIWIICSPRWQKAISISPPRSVTPLIWVTTRTS